MADSIQYCFPHGTLRKSGNVQYEKARLKILYIIATIDEIPEFVIVAEKALPKLFSMLSRAGGIRGTILKDGFALGKIFSQRLSRSEKDQRSKRDLPIDKCLGIGEQLFMT